MPDSQGLPVDFLNEAPKSVLRPLTSDDSRTGLPGKFLLLAVEDIDIVLSAGYLTQFIQAHDSFRTADSNLIAASLREGDLIEFYIEVGSTTVADKQIIGTGTVTVDVEGNIWSLIISKLSKVVTISTATSQTIVFAPASALPIAGVIEVEAHAQIINGTAAGGVPAVVKASATVAGSIDVIFTGAPDASNTLMSLMVNVTRRIL